MFSFIEKLFSKIYSHFPISAIFVEFGVIYCDFKKKKFFWDVISLMGLDKIFSFIEKLFRPSSGNMGFFCLIFARNKSLGMLLTYGDCKKCFLS